MSANKAILLGRLGKDPELKYTQSGKAVCSFSVATSAKHSGGEETTTWHNIVAWEKQAETIKEYLFKGSEIFIEGRIQNRSYDDKDGNKKYISEIVLYNFSFVGSKVDKKEVEPNEPEANPQTNNDDDGLPF